MRKILYLVYVLWGCSLCVAGAFDFASFFRELDSAYNRHDVPGIVRLAASTMDSGDAWTMGGSVGPTDSVSLRYNALGLIVKWLFNNK